MHDPLNAREQHIKGLIADAELSRQELADALARGDVYQQRATLEATNRRAAGDLRLARWFLCNGIAGVWRYIRGCWLVGWRRGLQRGRR